MIPFFGKTKPSEFLQAMVDGLEYVARQQKYTGRQEQYFVNMDTFGRIERTTSHKVLCFGCAATWALDALLSRHLTPDQVHALGSAMIRRGESHPDGVDAVRVLVSDALQRALDADQAERVCEFESVMDAARRGFLGFLEQFCETGCGSLKPWEGKWCLETGRYQDQLPIVRQAIENMQASDL